MKKHTYLFLIALTAICFAACNSNKEQSVTGIILDGSMNTLQIRTATGDTLEFSTMNADRTAANGILIGDTATVSYMNKLNPQLTDATKIVVIPAIHTSDLLIGSWVQPIPGMPDQIQGIDIHENGEASSINMATLVFESWSSPESDPDHQLILCGQSIGNGITTSFCDTVKIEKLTQDSLVLAYPEYVSRYSRNQQ